MNTLTCTLCRVTYSAANYHCCVCTNVFKTAGGFAYHRTLGHPVTQARLRKMGMRRGDDGAWRRPGSPYACSRRGEPHAGGDV